MRGMVRLPATTIRALALPGRVFRFGVGRFALPMVFAVWATAGFAETVTLSCQVESTRRSANVEPDKATMTLEFEVGATKAIRMQNDRTTDMEVHSGFEGYSFFHRDPTGGMDIVTVASTGHALWLTSRLVRGSIPSSNYVGFCWTM